MRRPTLHIQRSVIQKTLSFIIFIRVHKHPSYPQSSNKAKKLLQLKIHKGYKTMSDCRHAELTCPLHGHSSLMTPRGINRSKYADNGTANMAAMRGGLLRRRQRTRGWTNKHTCSRMFTNNCARFKDAETESCSSGHRKAATDSSSNQGGSKLHLKTKQQWRFGEKQKTVSSRVLPILLL